jgi:hypothetical protein
LREAEERSRYEKSQFVQKQALKSFKELKQHEFRLINIYRPETLAQNYDQYLKEFQDKERESAVKIEVAKLQDKEKRA